MTCRDYRGDLIEWARGVEPGRAARSHAGRCAGCAAFLESQRTLTAALQILASNRAPASAGRARLLPWTAAAALTVAATLLLFVSPVRRPVRVPETVQFVPIPYTVPLAPGEPATIVQMQIPVTALIAAGFPVPAVDPSTLIQADVLVSQDGRARAIRPLSISRSN